MKGIWEGLSRMRWKLSRTVLRGGVTGNGGSLLGIPQGDRKQPYYIRLLNSSVMGLAGLWETRENTDGSELTTCCILTTDANETVKPIHERMPVVLQPEDYNLWLNRNMHDSKELEKLYQPYPADLMYAHPVPDLVNIPRFDSASCIVQM